MPGIYVPAKGNANARIMIVGSHPSNQEEAQLEPFVGPGGRELDKILKQIGVNRSECWLSNVSKYMIPPLKDRRQTFEARAFEAGINLTEQIEDLRKEIKTINPNVIIALGEVGLHALTGKHKLDEWRGSILLSWLGKKVVCTYNPAQFLYQSEQVDKDYWKLQVCAFDFRRAKEESFSPELELPVRTLHVAHDSAEVYDFIERHKNATALAEDIEAVDCIPICIGLAFDKHEGLTIPLWEGASDTDLAVTWMMLAKLNRNPRFKKIGQNFKYDEDKITRLGLPIDSLYSDTMLKAFCINPELPVNLAFNTSIYTREPFYKNEGMYDGSAEDLLIGCARDSCITYEVDEAQEKDIQEMGLSDYYHNFLMKLHPLYLHIENQGFCINEEKRELLLRKYIEMDERNRYEMFKAVGHEINPNSPLQVAKLLYDELKIPEHYSRITKNRSTGEEVITQILNSTAVQDPYRQRLLENILESRRVRKTISNNLAAIRDYDGKVRTTYYICLKTGRSSTGQQEPPIRPTVEIVEFDENGKKHKKKRAMGTAFQVMAKHGEIGPEVRSMYEPEPGDIFLQADSSQAEARVIFLLAEDYEALREIDERDYHALTASWFFGGREDDYSKRRLGYESPYRFAGKTLRHAGHLGAGRRKAAIEVNTQARKFKINFTISEGEAGKALDKFHQKQPNIRGVYHASIIKCIQKNRMLRAPVPYGIDAKVGGTRIFYGRLDDELYRESFSYLPQRIVSENTKAAALRIREQASWIKIIVESHDALLVSIPTQRKCEAARILKSEFERPIDFSTCSLERGNLIIPCEIEEGQNYFEMSKFKELVTV